MLIVIEIDELTKMATDEDVLIGELNWQMEVKDAIKNGIPLPMGEYENIIDKYADNPLLCQKKINEWCVDTMRGICADYYAKKI